MRLKVAIVIGLGALAAAPLVLAQVQDRRPLRGQSGNPTDHYSPTLAIVAVSPPEYKRGCCYDHNGGEWTGPRYQATGRPSLGADSKYDWTVGVAVKAGATRAALIANLTHDFPVVAEGKQLVKHRVGGRAAGTISGYWVLTRSTFGAEDDARMEAAVGFPLCDGNTAYAKFSLLLPSGDSAGGSMGFGEYLINGTRPTVWNAAKGMQAIRGISLEGNRPSARVTARRRGAAITGNVIDCANHPLAGYAVRLERKTGSSWRAVGTGKTGAVGSFSLATRGPGVYRVVAGTRRSISVTVR
ncbi:MAG: hypothetical protein ACXWZY_01855 [Gaiellaceae bacterium]